MPGAFKRHDAGQNGNSVLIDAGDERAKLGRVEHWLCYREFRSGFDLVLETAELLVEIRCSGIDRVPDVKRGRVPDRLAADVEPRVEPGHHVRQSNRVDVE